MCDNIHLPLVNLTPTMRCNLNCGLCGVLVPQYDYRPHMTKEDFSKTLHAVFEIADSVGKLQITGGEPLLHPDLPEMLEECFQFAAKFEKLWLFTNCAVPLKPQLAEVLENYKDRMVVHASDYGVRQEITEQIVGFLEETGCTYRHLKYFGEHQYADGWVDQGDFVCHNRSEMELAEVFSRCTHIARGGSWYVRNGQMHWCGRSIRGVEVGKIPLCEEDYLDIFTGTVEERREKLSRLMQVEFIRACDYCNGYYGTENTEKRHPAGEQMQKC